MEKTPNRRRTATRNGCICLGIIAFYVLFVFPLTPFPHWGWMERRQIRNAVAEARRDRGIMPRNRWTEYNLNGLNLSHLTFDRPAFEYTWLVGTDLSHSDLRKANGYWGRFMRARFDGADMREARIEAAYCMNASFKGCNLRGAYFQSAKLYGADFTGADLTDAKFPGAFYDAQTKWPPGFHPQEHELFLRDEADAIEAAKQVPAYNPWDHPNSHSHF